MKLSNPTICTGERMPYPQMTNYARALVDLMADWIPDEKTRKMIMVDNPLKLCGQR